MSVLCTLYRIICWQIDSFAGVYIVMLMNSSCDDECLSGQTLNIPYCVSTPL